MFFMSPPAPKLGASKNMGAIYLKTKKRLRQRTHKLGASKILVPRKNGEPERRSLSVCRGARGAAGPPPGGLGGWKPPRNSRWSGGRQPPSKNNFMDPEPPSDHLQPLPTICQPPWTTLDNLPTTFTKHCKQLSFLGKRVKPVHPLSDKVFERPG